MYLFSQRIQVRLTETRAQLAAEHEALRTEQARSQRLLENILPLKVIDDLKQHGSSPPEVFEEVTVFFSDLVGFTERSSQIPPAELIAELSTIFGTMDELMAAEGCERIKTIGDAYLGVCGMPTRHADHAVRMVRAARRILAWLAGRNRTAAHAWHMRIGVHSGPVVGGIVGHQRYLYDVFGDAINTASRMESNGEPMRINVSQATWSRIRDEVACEDRGPLAVKGKGELAMYFVSE